MEFRTLFYSAARHGERPFDSVEVQNAVTAALGLLMPGVGFRVGASDAQRVMVSDPQDPDRRVSAAMGWLDGYQTVYLTISPGMMESVNPLSLQGFLTRVSRTLDLDVGRAHVDPDLHSLWPDEWSGEVKDVGWYQYFGARVAPRLEASTISFANLFSVERYEDGSVVLALRSGPLEDPSWEATDAVAAVLGITLRDSGDV